MNACSLSLQKAIHMPSRMTFFFSIILFELDDKKKVFEKVN